MGIEVAHGQPGGMQDDPGSLVHRVGRAMAIRKPGRFEAAHRLIEEGSDRCDRGILQARGSGRPSRRADRGTDAVLDVAAQVRLRAEEEEGPLRKRKPGR
jgi:hypothetical protein